MSSKLTFKKDIVFRWVSLLVASSLFSWTVGKIFDTPKEVHVEGNNVWCFHAEYQSMSDYKDTKPPQSAFIDIESGGSVRVFERCDPFYGQ